MEDDRFLSSEEIELLLNLSISSDKSWNMHLGTPDDDFYQAVADLFSDDSQVRIQRTVTACETLIACTRTIPDLLVLDANLPGIAPEVLITSIRADRGLSGMIMLCRLRELDPDHPVWGADDYLVQGEGLDKVYLARKIRAHFYTDQYAKSPGNPIGYERRWPRMRLNFQAKVDYHKSGDAPIPASGEATVENISLGGALLTGIKLPENGKPEDVSSIVLKIDAPNLQNWSADSVLVRLLPDGTAGFRFTGLSPEDRAKLLSLFS